MADPQPFNRDRVIKELFSSHDVSTAINSMHPEHLRDEMRQEVFVVLCTLPEDKLQGLHERGELKLFMFGALWRMVKSDRSTFYNTHRRYREAMLKGGLYVSVNGSVERDECADSAAGGPDGELVSGVCTKGGMTSNWAREDEPEEETSLTWFDLARYPEIRARVDEVLWTIDQYEADLFRLYLEMGESCAPISKATGIPQRSIRFAVAKAKEKLKAALQPQQTIL